jgi:hypothetical protein
VCQSYYACPVNAFCNASTGLCTAPQPDGSACESNRECQSDTCDEAPGDPTIGAVAGVCASAPHVTAAQCERASAAEPPPDSTEPDSAPNPPPGPGAP